MRALVLTAGMALFASAGLEAQARRWVPAQCELRTGHFLVNSGVLYLRSATEARNPAQRERDLGDAGRVLTQAVAQRQEDPAAWYYLGRYYIEVQDLTGADSAFTRAERLHPECGPDMAGHRRTQWAPLAQRGAELLQAGRNAEAREAFISANTIYRGEPQVMYYLGLIYQIEGHADSAAALLSQAADVGRNMADPGPFAELIEDASRRARALALEAAVMQADRAASRNPDQALAIYDSLLSIAHEIAPRDLFAIGFRLFEMRQPRRSARAFELGLERNQYFRDGWFNLANAYLAIAQEDAETEEEAQALRQNYGRRMLNAARQLIGLDPHSYAARRLVVAALQLLEEDELAVERFEALEAMQFDVVVDVFQPAFDGYLIRGEVRNRRDDETAVPALRFEFLSGDGGVVTTAVVASQTLAPGDLSSFELTVSATEIAGWRYRAEE